MEFCSKINEPEKEEHPAHLEINVRPVISYLNASSPKETNNTDNQQSSKERNVRFSNDNRDNSKEVECNKIRKKVFEARESYITELLKISHIRTIYNIFIVVFIFYLAYNIFDDYFANGRITLASGTFQTGFINFHYAFAIWVILQIYSCAIYYALKIWAIGRRKLQKQEFLQPCWSFAWLLLYITSQGLFFYIPAAACLKFNIKNASCFGLLFETMRLAMKQHAFVRVICGRILQGKLDIENNLQIVIMPPFQKYLYYLCAPTLLYCDDYPRTASVRWSFVAARFMECVAFVFLFAFLIENHLQPIMSNFGRAELSAGFLIRSFFGIQLTAMLMVLSFFFFLLHAWNNLTGELLYFSDRMFHRDWWLACNYFEFFRDWNTLVGDWLYEYIFKDFYRYVFKGSKSSSAIAVYVISAVAHEYFMVIPLRIYFPYSSILYIFGGIALVHISRWIPRCVGNIVFWLTFFVGNALVIGLYTAEYYCKKNLPKASYKNFLDLWIPHLWACNNTRELL
uniref:O-acyltransferase n=1 Tax=Musca domestica TaxID=7370 RepID=A0A1I8MJS1_MUSDO